MTSGIIHQGCRYYTALVTFERTEQETEYLPEEAHGAIGYFAIASTYIKSAIKTMRKGLGHEGLRLVEVDEISEFEFPNLPELNDEHLAQNVESWEPDKFWTWGTLHTYLGEGEA